MIDIKRLRQDFDAIQEKLAHRGEDLTDMNRFLALDEKRRELIARTEVLKAERNEATKKIAELKRNKENADEAIAAMRSVGDEIKTDRKSVV